MITEMKIQTVVKMCSNDLKILKTKRNDYDKLFHINIRICFSWNRWQFTNSNQILKMLPWRTEENRGENRVEPRHTKRERCRLGHSMLRFWGTSLKITLKTNKYKKYLENTSWWLSMNFLQNIPPKVNFGELIVGLLAFLVFSLIFICCQFA